MPIKSSGNFKMNHINCILAIREVEEAHKELKEMQDKQMEQKLAKQSKKPPPYKQIKVNTTFSLFFDDDI